MKRSCLASFDLPGAVRFPVRLLHAPRPVTKQQTARGTRLPIWTKIHKVHRLSHCTPFLCNIEIVKIDMAETITAITSLMSLTTRTSNQIARPIQEWKDAPTQVQLLAEEVESLRNVLLHLTALAQQLNEEQKSQSLAGYAEAITSQLQRVEPIWAVLDEILRSVSGPLNNKVRRDRWIKKTRMVNELQERLHKIRFSTMEILSSCAMSVTPPSFDYGCLPANLKIDPKACVWSPRSWNDRARSFCCSKTSQNP